LLSLEQPKNGGAVSAGGVGSGQGRRFLFTTIQADTIISSRLPLLRRMQNLGWEVHVALPRSSRAIDLAAWGIEVHQFDLKRGSANPILEGRSLFQLAKIVRSVRPHLSHHVSSKAVIYGSLMGSRINIATITGIGFSLNGANRGIRSLPVKIIAPFMYRKALGRCQKVIFQNESDKTTFVNRNLVEEQKTLIVPGSGVDVDAIRPLFKPASRTKVKFVLFARMIGSKGVYEYVEAARIVKRRLKDGCEFVLAGRLDYDNPTHIHAEQIAAWEREGVVKWLGEVIGPCQAFDEADVAVLPSYSEGLPRVCLEAAAMGLPVICTNVPGCADAVLHGSTGLHVNPRDPFALAEAMIKLAVNPSMRQAMGSAGRTRVCEQFGMNKILDQLLEIYDRELTAWEMQTVC